MQEYLIKQISFAGQYQYTVETDLDIDLEDNLFDYAWQAIEAVTEVYPHAILTKIDFTESDKHYRKETDEI